MRAAALLAVSPAVEERVGVMLVVAQVVAQVVVVLAGSMARAEYPVAVGSSRQGVQAGAAGSEVALMVAASVEVVKDSVDLVVVESEVAVMVASVVAGEVGAAE